MPLLFDISDSLHTTGFEIYQLTRMYSLNRMRPGSGQRLLGVWKSAFYKDLENRIWTEYQFQSAQKQQDLERLLRKVLGNPLNSFESTEGLLSTSEALSSHSNAEHQVRSVS